jgi:acetyl-CoA carboxylase carboxyl transferase subunit alpha
MANEDNFEEPIINLQQEIESLSGVGDDSAVRHQREKLQAKLESLRATIFSSLNSWQKTIVARHPKRPHTLDLVKYMCDGFLEIHGDRKYADDAAIVCGFATFRGRHVLVVGHEKGRQTKEKIRRNFGMARPEGYRKALRIMQMAEKFNRPILSFIDTPGAYPGIGAEERGQAEAIAFNLREMAKLKVPVLATVIGEGGSGGALGLGVGNRVNILEFAIYSVISPEGCAAILWRDAQKNREAASALKMTAEDLKQVDIVDDIIPEITGGAHTDHEGQAVIIADTLERQLNELSRLSMDELVDQRYTRFRNLGIFSG